MVKRLLLIFIIFIGSAVSGNADEKLSVFVSIVPQKYFVQQIGGDVVDVNIMVQPGASPATYEPKPRQMAELSKAKLYFSIGVPFENVWLKKIAASNPGMKVIHTDHGIKKISMAEYHHEGEEHHDKHGHGHTGLDPHIWTSPVLVKIQAETILKALKEAAPLYNKKFQTNYNKFADRIDTLDQALKQSLREKSGLQFIVFHPSWGYFARDYGLKQVPIEIEGKNPKPAQLKELIKHAKKDGIKVVFVQPQFSTKNAETIAGEIGGKVVFADPLAQDWIANMRIIADKFKTVLK